MVENAQILAVNLCIQFKKQSAHKLSTKSRQIAPVTQEENSAMYSFTICPPSFANNGPAKSTPTLEKSGEY